MKRVSIRFIEEEDRDLVKVLRQELRSISKKCCWLKKKRPMTEELKRKIDEYEEAEASIVEKLCALGDY